MPKTTLGKLPRDAIRMLELPRLPQDIVDGFKALVDLTGTISDAMDELGIVGVIPGLRAAAGHHRHAHRRARRSPCATSSAPRRSTRRRARQDQHPGRDRGAQPRRARRRAGDRGRDGLLQHGRTVGHHRPPPGLHRRGRGRHGARSRAVPQHGLAGVVQGLHADHRQVAHADGGSERRGRRSAASRCSPGDLVCADEAGVAFVPREQAAAVLEIARKIDGADTKRKTDIESGVEVSDLVTRKYK